jgi:rfaE bifunctional protein kinase chain/domain
MKLVLVTGVFSVLHPGHLRLFRFAKECGDRLVVGVYADSIAKAWVPENLRLEGVQSNSWVDEAFLIQEPIEQVIARFKEHESRFNPEAAALREYGGKLLFSSGEVAFSSLDLIRKEYSVSPVNLIEFPNDYLHRHGIELNGLRKLVQSFGKLRVCVIGDLIIDEYITCQPLGMSQEDPTVVVMPIDSKRFIGGAGIVAAHAAGLGATVQFLSVTGSDSGRQFALENLNEMGVQAYLFEDPSRPTTLKKRFRSHGKSLLRVSELHQAPIDSSIQELIYAQIADSIDEIDLLVFSDFNYGCLPQQLVERIIGLGHQHGVMMVADSQSSSQVGNISRFKDMNLITPTEREARISVRNHEDGLVVLAQQLKSASGAKNILLKLGGEGVLVHGAEIDDRIGALNQTPKDVAGAGDSLLISSAMALARGGNIWEAALLGSLAAAIQVGRVGNTPIESSELLAELVS